MPYAEFATDIIGLISVVLALRTLGFTDPTELSRAALAWRYNLSQPQVRLLELLTQGLSDIEIAVQIGVAEVNTVKNQLRAVYKKLGVRSRTQAAIIAALYGLADHPPFCSNPNE